MKILTNQIKSFHNTILAEAYPTLKAARSTQAALGMALERPRVTMTTVISTSAIPRHNLATLSISMATKHWV